MPTKRRKFEDRRKNLAEIAKYNANFAEINSDKTAFKVLLSWQGRLDGVGKDGSLKTEDGRKKSRRFPQSIMQISQK